MAQQLIWAAQSGDITSVRRLVEGGTNVNATDRNGETALHHAAHKNQGAVVDYLLDKGANVNKQSNNGLAALHRAAVKGHVNISKSLLARGADIGLCENNGQTALWLACFYGNLDVVQYLISKGADINKTSKAGSPPLHIACQEGHIQIADFLLSRGVDVNTAMHDGRTPLHAAAGTDTGGGHLDMVKFLVTRGASINHRDSTGRTALNIASQYGHIDIVKYLINAGAEFKEGDNEGWTPLHSACTGGHLHVAQLLVSLGADINKVKNDGGTPLTEAAWNGRLDTVKYLISNRAVIDTQDNFGSIALHWASEKGHSNVVDFLLQDKSKGGPMINQTNKAGATSLHLATRGGHTPVVDVLLSHGADINFLDAGGQSCLHLAAELCNKPDVKLEMTSSLTQVSSKLSYNRRREAQCLVIYLEQRGADVNIKDKRGRTPLDCVMDTLIRTSIGSLMSTPLEILARGPEALKAYNEAIQTGEKKIYRTRLMLVGQERVGKTSLKKSLTGQKFDQNEPVTHGVETLNHCEINVDVAVAGNDSWSLQSEKDALAKIIGEEYKQAVAQTMAEKLKKKLGGYVAEEGSRNLLSSGSRPGKRTYTATASPVSIPKQVEKRSVVISSQKPVTIKEQNEIDPDVSKLLKSTLKLGPKPAVQVTSNSKSTSKSASRSTKTTEKDEDSLKFHIWDFAGHELYYTTHQVFLSWRAIYLLVFNLSRDLDEIVADIFPEAAKAMGGSQSDLSHHEFIYFWIASIIAHASPPAGRDMKGKCSPKIFIIGTHRDSLPGTEQAKAKQIHSIFEKIRKGMVGTPFEPHVIKEYYAIENRLGSEDPGLKALQAHILKIAKDEPYMGERIPLRWLKFEETKDNPKMSPMMKINEIKDVSSSLGIGGDLQTMLQFNHDLGRIIYFGNLCRDKSYLKDTVILDPKWLIEVFKEIITLNNPDGMDASVSAMWKQLKNEGLLQGRLISHVWSRFPPIDQLRLLDIVEQFELICAAPRDNEKLKQLALDYTETTSDLSVSSLICHRNYYVPSQLNPLNKKDMGPLVHWKSLTFFVDFHGLFTIGLFHRLMSRITQQVGSKVKLYYRQIFFPAQDDHLVLIEMIPHPEALIKVTVYRVLALGEEALSPDDTRPSPSICREVREAFCRSLDEMCKDWMGRVMDYEIQFKCLIAGCKLRYPLKLCHNMAIRHQCEGHSINLNAVREMFGIFSHVMALTSGGGRISFKPLGIHTVIPRNVIAADHTQDIMISAITNVSKYIPVRDDEILVAFGIQCLPDGLQLPASITIPHCVPLSRLGEVTPVVYSGSGQIGTNISRQILPKGVNATSLVEIREKEIQLRIDHFSWHIVAFIRSLYTRQIEICCFPLLPTCMPLGRKVTLHVQIYKAKKGIREVMETKEPLGYIGADKEKKFPILTNKANLDLVCIAQHEKSIQKELDVIDYNTLMEFGSITREFEFDFSRSPSNETTFSITIAQRDESTSVPDKTELKFDYEFEGNMFLNLSK